MHPKSKDHLGWIDFSILDDVNAIVKHTGYQFKEVFTDDETTCIIFLTPEQEEKLRQERKWQFAGDPEVERRMKEEMEEFGKDLGNS